MERKIEFRGKIIDSDKWAFGDLHRNSYGKISILDPSKYDCDTIKSDFEVEEKSIGQFVREINGNKYFEGDIALMNYKKSRLKVVLTWVAEKAAFMWLETHEYILYKYSGGNLKIKNTTLAFPFDEDTSSDFEIIGNTWDFPSLLAE